MNYPLSIKKNEINELPLYRFKGQIEVVESPEAVTKAIKYLREESVLGFDTETRPAYRAGQYYDVSLLQLATKDRAYLFRLQHTSLPVELIEILSDPNIVKAGVAIRDDVKALQSLKNFAASNFVDLAKVAKEKGILNFGLRALTAIFLSKRLSKTAKLTNWDQNTLSSAQISYAASDAAVGFEIYFKILNMNQ